MDVDFTRFVADVWSVVRLLPWHWIAPVTHMALAIWATTHAMLYKRDPRAALGWVAVCLFFPFLGPLAYYMFGINRIRTQARKIAGRHLFTLLVEHEQGARGGVSITATHAPDLPFRRFAHVSDRVATQPLASGNTIDVLENGEQAYPAMLAAIDAAVQRVFLISYLFESDAVGKSFIRALTAAHRRGVDVRVIVDGVGDWYSIPWTSRLLRRAGVRVARFLPPRLLPPSFSINLRNHRKILVVDGEYGFTGGMNIGVRHLLDSPSKQATADLHFKVQGAAVSQLEAIFVEDWRFASGEDLTVQPATHRSQGEVYCRCLSDGPNEDLDKISQVLMGAISVAEREILLLTPYFLPSREMMASLQSAALRGVTVTVILPQKSNLPFVDWATRNLLWELLQYGVKVCYQPPPFAHTKLFIVDGIYAQVGSANMDPRSLRLNFELNLELYGTESVERLLAYAQQRQRESTEIGLPEIEGRGLATRLRDAACWLFLPYL